MSKAEEAKRKAESEAEAKKKETSSDGRYWKSDQGVITDTKTGLEWVVGPDTEMTWYEAKAWVESLNAQKFAGRTDWRMPTPDELLGIYEEKKPHGRDYTTPYDSPHLDSIFNIIASYVWSVGPGLPVNFHHGLLYCYGPGANIARVFAVAGRS